ncbi:DUF2922 family protein [Peptococcaceae bacterium]
MPDTNVEVRKKLNLILGCSASNSKGSVSINDPSDTADAETVMVAGEAAVAKNVLVNSKGEVYDTVMSAAIVETTTRTLF